MKTKIMALAFASLGIMPSQAVSTINFDFGALTIPGSALIADGSAVYLFVSTTGVATDLVDLQTSLAGIDLNIGSVFGTDKRVIGISSTSGGFGGGVAADVLYTNGVSALDALGILFVQQGDGPLVNGSKFGLFTSPTFTMPADGSNVTIDFLDVTSGGLIPDGSLVTTNAVVAAIPEPSAALLGAVGALGLLRRRRI